MDARRRDEILERVRAFLESLEDDEPPPEGVDPALLEASGDTTPDLASLAAAVAHAAREVEIQNKVVKRLVDAVDPVAAAVGDLSARIEGIRVPDPEAWSEAVTRAQREGEAAGHDEALRDWFELHDRLSRCVEESRRSREALSRLARWGGAGGVIDGVTRGVELTLERLEEILERSGVERIESTGRAFDARTMRAVEVAPPSNGVRPGDVLETLRAGFARGSSVLRAADVRVAGDPGRTGRTSTTPGVTATGEGAR